jgi:hypothetical protein
MMLTLDNVCALPFAVHIRTENLNELFKIEMVENTLLIVM